MLLVYEDCAKCDIVLRHNFNWEDFIAIFKDVSQSAFTDAFPKSYFLTLKNSGWIRAHFGIEREFIRYHERIISNKKKQLCVPDLEQIGSAHSDLVIKLEDRAKKVVTNFKNNFYTSKKSHNSFSNLLSGDLKGIHKKTKGI